MGPLRIDAKSALEEVARYSQKLTAGAGVLRKLDDVHYGATAKEEIYREDKVVLYRFKGDKAWFKLIMPL